MSATDTARRKAKSLTRQQKITEWAALLDAIEALQRRVCRAGDQGVINDEEADNAHGLLCDTYSAVIAGRPTLTE